MKRLPDGSYLSKVHASTKDRCRDKNRVVVRMIEYRLEAIPVAEPLHTLVTTILDPEQAPAKEPALYHEKWEIENALEEITTHLRDARIVTASFLGDVRS